MSVSGAQVVAVAAWLSVLAAPWYALVADAAPRETAGVMGVSVLVGLAAAALHAGDMARRRRAAVEAAARIRRGYQEERE